LKKIVIAAFISILTSNAVAQISSSPYSAYGVGLLKLRTSPMNRAMGGTGFAVRDPSNLNNLNPAAYTSIQQATHLAEFGLFVESDRYGNTKQSTTSGTGNITSLNLWLRFNKRWAGTVGVSPFSTVSYNIASTQTIGDNGGLQYSGKGGITQFYFGNGIQITKNLSVGVTGSFLHGSIDKIETITSGYALGTQLSNLVAVNKGKLDFGVQYVFPLGTDKSLTIGGIYEGRLRLNTTNQTTIMQQLDTVASDNAHVDDYVLPQKGGGGIAFQTLQQTFTVDVSYQEWRKARLEDNLRLRNTRRASFGYQFRGDPRSAFWGGFTLRAGGYIQENPLVLQKTTFRDWGATVGIGLPVSNGRNSLNLSYGYNRSGTLANNLISQQSHIFTLDITFRDLWGIKRKFD
jgi:hypothetical protein